MMAPVALTEAGAACIQARDSNLMKATMSMPDRHTTAPSYCNQSLSCHKNKDPDLSHRHRHQSQDRHMKQIPKLKLRLRGPDISDAFS